MPSRHMRSVSTPIVLTAVAVSLSIALLVGWTLVIVHTLLEGPKLAGGVWLLVSGIASFGFVVTVLVLFGISLVREILESRRQVSFIDSVTHELKSPLASLRLCLQTLARPNLSEAQRADLLQMMEADVSRLSSFIDDVLNASRVTTGRPLSLVSELDLAGLVRAIGMRVSERHGLQPESLRMELEEGLKLSTDRASLEVAISNLVDNAVKYSDPPVEVDVRAARLPDGKVVIEVEDRGIGIEQRDLKRVFQRFYRVPDQAVRARRGTGLGLYVAAAMIRGLGGRIRAESPGLGKGAVMRIVLPAKLGSASAPDDSSSGAAP